MVEQARLVSSFAMGLGMDIEALANGGTRTGLQEEEWSAWRASQLPKGRPAPREILVVVEARCATHALTARSRTISHDLT